LVGGRVVTIVVVVVVSVMFLTFTRPHFFYILATLSGRIGISRWRCRLIHTVLTVVVRAFTVLLGLTVVVPIGLTVVVVLAMTLLPFGLTVVVLRSFTVLIAFTTRQ